MTETKELTIKIVGFAMTVFHWWRGELLTRCYLKKKWLARPNTCKKTDQTKLLLRYTCLPPSVLSGQRPWRLSIRHTEKEKAIYFDVSPFFSILILEAVLQITQWRYFPLFPSKTLTEMYGVIFKKCPSSLVRSISLQRVSMFTAVWEKQNKI